MIVFAFFYFFAFEQWRCEGIPTLLYENLPKIQAIRLQDFTVPSPNTLLSLFRRLGHLSYLRYEIFIIPYEMVRIILLIYFGFIALRFIAWEGAGRISPETFATPHEILPISPVVRGVCHRSPFLIFYLTDAPESISIVTIQMNNL